MIESVIVENSLSDREERTDRDQREGGGDTGEEVVKYSGRGVDTMGGREGGREREKKRDKEGTGEGICEELKAAEGG